MLDKETLLFVLEMYINDEITQEELSKWAYEMIVEADGTGDPLVMEILFSLVSLHEAGLEFTRNGTGLEKLQYFINWLENDNDDNKWPDYPNLIDPNKLM